MNALARPAAMLFVALLVTSTASSAPLAHIVFFSLKEDTQENRGVLIKACHKYLKDHQGEVYFSVGEIAAELDREVNDQGFQVALHLVFDSMESHDVYQSHPRHLEFIDIAVPMIEKVRVFDSKLKEPAGE